MGILFFFILWMVIWWYYCVFNKFPVPIFRSNKITQIADTIWFGEFWNTILLILYLFSIENFWFWEISQVFNILGQLVKQKHIKKGKERCVWFFFSFVAEFSANSECVTPIACHQQIIYKFVHQHVFLSCHQLILVVLPKLHS